MTDLIHLLHRAVWGPWLLAIFLGAGGYLTIRSRGFQIRGFGTWMGETAGKLAASRKPGKSKREEEAGHPSRTGVSQFQTACTALAATVGTGNIVGVATALAAGGPGAVFWMWVSALIGMMTAYGETWLGILYRHRKADGKWICGPMVTLEKGAKRPGLARIYALLCVLASLGMGSMVQANSLAETAEFTWQMPRIWCALILTIAVGLVIQGGIGRIASAAEQLIPWSAGIYLITSLTVLFICRRQIPGVILDIMTRAFSPSEAGTSAVGAAAGLGMKYAVQYGIARGVFSNEAGLGSLAILHGTAEDTSPEEQGMWAMFEVFFDTVLVCTVTALVILCAAARKGFPIEDGASLAVRSFSAFLGEAGEYTVAVSMMLFAFATIIAWHYMGKQAAEYLLRDRKTWISEWGYIGLYLAAVFGGCIAKVELVWELSDIWNGLMAIPNIAAILLLADQIRYPAKKRKSELPLDSLEEDPYTYHSKRE